MGSELTLAGGSVLVGGRFVRADLAISDGKIEALGLDLAHDGEVVDCSDRFVVPGLIDLHVMGGGMRTFTSHVDESSYETIARAHAATGTTALCPTVVPGSMDQALEAVSLAAGLCEREIPRGAAFVGVHACLFDQVAGAEGNGRQQLLSPAFAKDLVAAGRGWLRLVTLPPEGSGVLPVIRYLAGEGVHVAAGHTSASAAEMQAAMTQGLAGVTNLFNDMSGVTGREAGPAGVALSSGLYAGFVGDLVHINRDTLAAVLGGRVLGRLFLTTAAAAAMGEDVETFEVGDESFAIRDGACYASNGELVGSVTPLSRMVRNLIRDLEIPVDDAVAMASAVPARCLGLRDRGEIRPGCVADVLVIERHKVDSVILRGKVVETFPNYRRL